MKNFLLIGGILIAVISVTRIIVGSYQDNMKSRIEGMTSETGWQVGVRKTFPVSMDNAWNFLVSSEGTRLWLGTGFDLIPGKVFTTEEGIEGSIAVVKHLSHIRMTWKKPDWNSYSTFQVRVFQGNEGTMISFHQDRLSNEFQRAEMRHHWNDVLEAIAERFSSQ
jgi:uncharacterized protein YndB with AHSA1/START domain